MTTLYDFFVKEQESKRIGGLFAEKFYQSDFDRFVGHLGLCSTAKEPKKPEKINQTYTKNDKVVFSIRGRIDIRGNSVVDYFYDGGGLGFRMNTPALLEDFDSWLTELKCFVFRIEHPDVSLRTKRHLATFLFYQIGLLPEFLD